MEFQTNKEAKNNRSVNLAKLKNILDKLRGCSISRESGSWKFEYDPALVLIDFLDYLKVFNSHPLNPSSHVANQLLHITRPGLFLQRTHYEWLDPVKAGISNFVIETLLKYSMTVDIHKDCEKLIAVSDAIFSFDELNEHALKLKCKTLVTLGRHALAKNIFDKFCTKYKDICGENFKEDYSSIIN